MELVDAVKCCLRQGAISIVIGRAASAIQTRPNFGAVAKLLPSGQNFGANDGSPVDHYKERKKDSPTIIQVGFQPLPPTTPHSPRKTIPPPFPPSETQHRSCVKEERQQRESILTLSGRV